MICTLILLVILCYGTEAKTDDEYKDLIIKLHNNYRKQQHASNMNALVWNETLAQIADRWLANCIFDHEKKGFGENLYRDSNEGKSSEEHIGEAMQAWYDEIKYYTVGSTGGCGMACHFTQVVWHNTAEVGCAEVRCPKYGWMFGCWYTPKGNWVREKAFETGSPCTTCLEGQKCTDELCTEKGMEPCEDKETECASWAIGGQCKSNPEYMARNCRLSCSDECKGKAGQKGNPAQKGECKDVAGSAQCKGWDYSCKTNAQFMQLNCAKTCEYCKEQ